MFQSAKLTLYYYKTSIWATYFRQLAFLGKKYGEKEVIGSFFRQKGVVYGLKGPLGRIMYKKLFVYAGPEHKHEAQKPETLTF